MSARRPRADDAPLFAWGEALRVEKCRRSRLRRWFAIGGAGISLLLSSAALPPTLRLVWNASASAPIGLYWVTPDIMPEPGDMVVARVPQPYRRMAAARRYLPVNVPLVKRVAASAGDDVCAANQIISVNGHWIATSRKADMAGRPMPSWQGCVRLRGTQLFLLMDNPASFDGRYFGLTEGSDVIGKARLLWRR